jgi:hypothetical protein
MQNKLRLVKELSPISARLNIFKILRIYLKAHEIMKNALRPVKELSPHLYKVKSI